MAGPSARAQLEAYRELLPEQMAEVDALAAEFRDQLAVRPDSWLESAADEVGNPFKRFDREAAQRVKAIGDERERALEDLGTVREPTSLRERVSWTRRSEAKRVVTDAGERLSRLEDAEGRLERAGRRPEDWLPREAAPAAMAVALDDVTRGRDSGQLERVPESSPSIYTRSAEVAPLDIPEVTLPESDEELLAIVESQLDEVSGVAIGDYEVDIALSELNATQSWIEDVTTHAADLTARAEVLELLGDKRANDHRAQLPEVMEKLEQLHDQLEADKLIFKEASRDSQYEAAQRAAANDVLTKRAQERQREAQAAMAQEAQLSEAGMDMDGTPF